MTTRLPVTTTNGRESEVPGVTIDDTALASHVVAPRGSRQNRNVATLLSGPFQAMYAVPAASTATPGAWPGPIAIGSPAAAVAGASSAPATVIARSVLVIVCGRARAIPAASGGG